MAGGIVTSGEYIEDRTGEVAWLHEFRGSRDGRRRL